MAEVSEIAESDTEEVEVAGTAGPSVQAAPPTAEEQALERVLRQRKRGPVLMTDDLVCPICTEARDDILLFPCHRDGHSACKDCVESMAGKDGKLHCHGCLQTFENVRAGDLEPDPFLQALAKRLLVGCR
jgi:hypothetical protein